MHDNNGREDQHLSIGKGNINWKKVIKMIKKYYDKTITLEVFEKNKKYILLSKNKLERLWKDA